MRQCNKCGYEEKCDHKKCPKCGKGCMRLMKRCNVCFRYFPNGKLAEHMQKHHKQERMVYVVLEPPMFTSTMAKITVFHRPQDAVAPVIHVVKELRGVGWGDAYDRAHTQFFTLDDGAIPDSAVLNNLLAGKEVRVGNAYIIRPEKVR